MWPIVILSTVMNIYIANISFQVEQSTLKSAFEKFGEVTSVKIIKDHATERSKGFGFVEMSDDAQAQKAISTLNGSEPDWNKNRKLVVNEAKPRT